MTITDFYIGANGGAAWNNTNVDSSVNSDELGPLANELKNDLEETKRFSHSVV